jgi:hypothetical protein
MFPVIHPPADAKTEQPKPGTVNPMKAIFARRGWSKRTAVATILLGAIQCATAQEDLVQFRLPMDGQVVRPGQTLLVAIDVDPSLSAEQVELIGGLGSGIDNRVVTGPPFETTVVVPASLKEPLKLIASASSSTDPSVSDVASVLLSVVPEDPPVTIDVMEAELWFEIPTRPDPKRITAFGTYADGEERAIDYPGMGTTYESSDTSVATVDGEGSVAPVAPGFAYITVRNGAATEWVGVKVAGVTVGDMPIVDQTLNVAIGRSGFRVDPASGLFTQQVTVTNRSPEPLIQPLALVLADLPPEVRVEEADKTLRIAPVGTPWKFFTGDREAVLKPGDSLSAEIKFRNPKGVPITYTPSVYSTELP